jgi:hypothetical protein
LCGYDLQGVTEREPMDELAVIGMDLDMPVKVQTALPVMRYSKLAKQRTAKGSP